MDSVPRHDAGRPVAEDTGEMRGRGVKEELHLQDLVLVVQICCILAAFKQILIGLIIGYRKQQMSVSCSLNALSFIVFLIHLGKIFFGVLLSQFKLIRLRYEQLNKLNQHMYTLFLTLFPQLHLFIFLWGEKRA